MSHLARGMGRKHTLILLIAAALVVGATFWWWPRSDPPAEPASDEAQANEERAVPVYAHTVQPQLLTEEIVATGTLRAAEAVDLVSELTSKIIALEFAEGARVEAGALLVKLDDTELRAQLEAARHRVALARVEAERQRGLLAAQGTTQQAFDAAINEAKVLDAEANLIRAQLEKTEIRAPFAGVVGLRYVSVGSFVDPSTRIATLQNLTELKADFGIAERHMGEVATGAGITVTLPGRAEPLAGEVYAIEPRIDPDTRTVQLRARVANPGGVMPGAFVTVRLVLREIPQALVVPATALVPGLNEQRVFIIVNGRAESRVVRTGIRRSRDVEIVEGVEPGTVVVTSGQLQLRPGSRVRAVERPREDEVLAATP